MTEISICVSRESMPYSDSKAGERNTPDGLCGLNIELPPVKLHQNDQGLFCTKLQSVFLPHTPDFRKISYIISISEVEIFAIGNTVMRE